LAPGYLAANLDAAVGLQSALKPRPDSCFFHVGKHRRRIDVKQQRHLGFNLVDMLAATATAPGGFVADKRQQFAGINLIHRYPDLTGSSTQIDQPTWPPRCRPSHLARSPWGRPAYR